MKTKNCKLVFVMLMVCITPLCVYGAKPAEPNASNPKHNPQKLRKNETEDKSITNAPNVENDKESFIKKIQQMQYTQLLEVHRSYFTVFLQVLSAYLAIMGACLKIVSDSIEKFINPKSEDGSKTVLIVIILFSLVASGLFYKGLEYGQKDANKRNTQIGNIEKDLQIVNVEDRPKIKHISGELLSQVISAMSFVTKLIIWIWIVLFVRGLMACAGKLTLRDFMSYLKVKVLQRFKQCTR